MTSRSNDQKIPDHLRWVITGCLTMLSMLGTGYVAYSNNDKDLTSRIRTIESLRVEDHERLERIEEKLDRVIERGLH